MPPPDQMVAAQRRHVEEMKRQHDKQLREQSELEKRRLAESLAAQQVRAPCFQTVILTSTDHKLYKKFVVSYLPGAISLLCVI